MDEPKLLGVDELDHVSLDKLRLIPEEFHPRGVLAGVRLGPRKIAMHAHDAGFRDIDLFKCVAVCGAESWLYTRASNDNKSLVTDLSVGQVVLNVETLETTTVLDPSTGKVRLSNGDVVHVPTTTLFIVSRDVGLMEINIPAAAVGTDTEMQLYDPIVNFARAFSLFTSRGWQPWAAFNSNAYLHDTYMQWAMLGVANWWGEIAHEDSVVAGLSPKTQVPWISLKQLRSLYPNVQLG